jgi:hypothetical protein
MCGSRPLAEAVTRSTGTGAVLPGSAARRASTRPLTASSQRRVQRALVGAAGGSRRCRASGRWPRATPEMLGSLKFWPIRAEPTGLPSRRIRLPAACAGNSQLRDAGDEQRIGDAGHTVSTEEQTRAGRRMGFMAIPPQTRPRADQQQVDGLDADEGHDQAAQPVDQQVAAQQRAAPIGAVGTPLSASGIRNTMISALKITADRMAELGSPAA